MSELRLENSIVDDRYEVDHCLGRGSFAEIFLAYDRERQGEAVIIKALNMTLQGTPDAELERTLVENFQNEAIALDRVRHPNIIRRLGHGTAADLAGVPFHYLVLEYMPGGDLMSLCRARPMTLERAQFYFKQVAEALAYAHSQGVIHRDIKPNNLLLAYDRQTVKIADFGVAKMAHEDGAEITRVGTNVYAPPEHHPDSPEGVLNQRLTPSADVYSLAKTVYTAMTARAPRQFSRRPVTELPPELAREPWGADLLRVLERATQALPADRYATVQDFWQEFARLGAPVVDPEATVVRARLSGTSNVPRLAPRPDFHALALAPAEGPRPQKARIVVDLPRQVKEAPPAAEHRPTPASNGAPQPPGAPRVNLHRPQAAAAPAAPQEAAVVTPGAPARPRRASEEDLSTFFDDLRRVVSSKWLRAFFIVFLLASLLGFSATLYYRFSGQPRAVPELPNIFFGGKEGVIARAPLVNLRSGPWGDVLAELPAGSRVRVVDSRDGWVRVRVVEWRGGAPAGAPDGGWLDGRFVQFD